MFSNRFHLLKRLLPLLLTANLCFCNAENFDFSTIDVKQMIRNEFFVGKNNATIATILSPIIESNSNNWTKKTQVCLKELNEIFSGFNNDEEWAVKCK